MRLFPAAALLAATTAFAQLPPQDTKDDSAAPGRRNQRIEHLVHEDAGSRIEELRVGGQMQSITVQPKGDLPAYSVEPNTARNRPREDRSGSSETGGTRSWSIFRF